MLNISDLHLASLLMDAAAMFLIIGTMASTYIYRKRGRMVDKLFFIMLVIDMVMAISDGITYVVDGATISGVGILSIVCNNIFFLAFEAMCGVLAVYMDCRINADKPYSQKKAIKILLPAIISFVMILANNLVHFLYWVDLSTNEYYQYPLYTLVFVAPVIYMIYVIYALYRIDRSIVWIFIVLIVVRVFFANIMQGVSSTALIFAMGLVFVHIHYMRLPFYDKEVL